MLTEPQWGVRSGECDCRAEVEVRDHEQREKLWNSLVELTGAQWPAPLERERCADKATGTPQQQRFHRSHPFLPAKGSWELEDAPHLRHPPAEPPPPPPVPSTPLSSSDTSSDGTPCPPEPPPPSTPPENIEGDDDGSDGGADGTDETWPIHFDEHGVGTGKDTGLRRTLAATSAATAGGIGGRRLETRAHMSQRRRAQAASEACSSGGVDLRSPFWFSVGIGASAEQLMPEQLMPEQSKPGALDPAAEAWREEWQRRLEVWWLALPLADQVSLGSCMGALGLHLGARFEAALRGWFELLGRQAGSSAGSPPPAASHCEGLLGETRLPDFPDLPHDALKLVVPIPGRWLLPDWLQLQSRAAQRNAQEEAAVAPRTQRHAAMMSSAMGLGFLAGVVVFTSIAWRRRGRKLHGHKAPKDNAASLRRAVHSEESGMHCASAGGTRAS